MNSIILDIPTTQYIVNNAADDGTAPTAINIPISFQVVDESGAGVADIAVSFSANSSAVFSEDQVNSDANGKGTATLECTYACLTTITATLPEGTKTSGTLTTVTQFKEDVNSFISYTSAQVEALGQNLYTAISQLSTSVTSGDIASALAAFEADDQSFNTYAEQSFTAASQNVDSAFSQLQEKYQ